MQLTIVKPYAYVMGQTKIENPDFEQSGRIVAQKSFGFKNPEL